MTSLVLVPGLLCDHRVWHPVANTLKTQAEIHVADHAQCDSITTMAERVLALAPRRFAIAGHSMGGRVALEVMRHAPERIDGLALLDTGYQPRESGAAGEREAASRHALLALARTQGMRAMGWAWLQNMVHPSRLGDSLLIDTILDMIAGNTPDKFAAQIHALLNRPDATDVLATVDCPTLVLCGEQDTWSPWARHSEIAGRIRGSTLVSVADCGHMSTLERPEAVTAALGAWLTALTSSEQAVVRDRSC